MSYSPPYPEVFPAAMMVHGSGFMKEQRLVRSCVRCFGGFPPADKICLCEPNLV